ncbi:hypothetical protein [Desulfonema ishimotonii]|uniref:hypothetical protein n=1 Tax=Desulfonema ishimotonii TaxID=45657 RepID=UPI000F57E380|nr:hypothetical protein [Desulfonema ishimotonii]
MAYMAGCSVGQPAEYLFEKFGDRQTFFIFAKISEIFGKQREYADFRQVPDKKGNTSAPCQSFIGFSDITDSVFRVFGHSILISPGGLAII